MTTVSETASRILDEGSRALWWDDYDQRLDYLAQELSGEDVQFQAEVLAEILRQDDGAFESWLQTNRLNELVSDGRVTSQERDQLANAFAHGIGQGTIPADDVPGEFVRDAHSPALTAAYMDSQDLDDRDGFNRALDAFAGLPADQMSAFINNPENAALVQKFELAVQGHQDWYENRTMDLWVTGGGYAQQVEGEVQFSVEQLQAMREGFRSDDGFYTNGELLLAYPDRAERNEQVTRQYYELSTAMSGIVGDDNANWASFAVWASDEIGRNLEGTTGIALGEMAFGDPRFWLSKGNSMLISDIGPGFQYFTQTFANGQNRDMTFEQFWSNFEREFAGRNISYLPGGSGDPENDMKNAFKAYYEAMQLHDQEQAASDPAQRAELADRRGDLMLYANTLVGLQEQEIVQSDIENGMDTAVGVNLWGLASGWIDFHLPGADGTGERRIDTDQDMPQQDRRVDPAGTRFTTVDGRTIQLDQALRERLNGLPGDIDGDGDEYDIGNSGTDHWEGYGERMGSIYHLFANFQQYEAIFADPREVFGTRAQELENDPQYPL